MIDGSHSVPLSPPSSPRMSAYTATHPDPEWHSQPVKPSGGVCAPPEAAGMGLLHNAVNTTQFDIKDRPPLHTHKSYPYALNQISHSQQQTGLSDHHILPLGQRDRGSIGNTDPSDSASLSVSYGASAPTSPSSRLTPASPGSGVKHERDDDLNDQNLSGSAEEGDQDKPMTAAELRAQKRKMKRFRLTHNQTRFLMSEFARQAHPDAAHRERLAREIPGLSPRQVQVWFQNRRAKLKRLTSDDRERMMRSRALPDDFDMTQALHSPFGTAGHHSVGGTPMASPATYSPSFPEGNMVRPLTVDTFRRFPDGTQMPPGGVNPSFGSFSFTPPQSATDTSSPVSATGDASAFPFSSQGQGIDGTNPRRSNPFIGGTGPAASSFSSYSPMPRVQLDRMGRSRAESLCSPLRTSMSYSNDGSLNQSTAQPGAAPDGPGMGDRQIPQTTVAGGSLPGVTSENVPYGLGYSYNQMPGFESSRMRSMSSTLPRRIELSQHSAHYNASRTAPTNPQSATIPNYQTSPLGTPSSYPNPSMMSAPNSVASFNSSPAFTEPNYNAPSASHGDPYAIGNVLGDGISDPQHAESKGTGGVQIPRHY
ncbi:hypothetical protein BKA81DRAFT_376692 [Phyllosticta paracitricarpa]